MSIMIFISYCGCNIEFHSSHQQLNFNQQLLVQVNLTNTKNKYVDE